MHIARIDKASPSLIRHLARTAAAVQLFKLGMSRSHAGLMMLLHAAHATLGLLATICSSVRNVFDSAAT